MEAGTHEASERHREELRKVKEEKECVLQQVFNGDETQLAWKIILKGKVSFKKDRKRIESLWL